MSAATFETADEVVDAAAPGTAVATLAPLEQIRAGLVSLQHDAAELVAIAADTPARDRAERAFRLRCVSTRTALDAAYEAVNRPMLNLQRQARALLADIKAQVEKLEAPVDQAIRERELKREQERAAKAEAERRRVAAIREQIDSIAAVARRAVGKPSADIDAKIRIVVGLAVDAATFGEFEAEAKRVHGETLATLRETLEAALAAEAEAARIAAERAELARAREAQAAEDALVADILTPRVEGNSTGYVQKAITEMEGWAKDWESDPRPRVAAAVATVRQQLAARLAHAQQREKLERDERMQQRLHELRAIPLPLIGRSSELLATVIEGLPVIEPGDWAEYADEAQQARDGVLTDLRKLQAAAAERERVAAEQAAERDRLVKQQAEQARQDAEARAAREQADREAARLRATEQRKLDAERSELERHQMLEAHFKAAVDRVGYERAAAVRDAFGGSPAVLLAVETDPYIDALAALQLETPKPATETQAANPDTEAATDETAQGQTAPAYVVEDKIAAAAIADLARELTDARAALAEALELLEGWIAFKCAKKYQAEHRAKAAELARRGGLAATEGKPL